MTQWLAGMRLTADRLNDNTIDDTTSTGATAATGFSVNDFFGQKVNGITTITISCTRSGANIAEIATNSGNISDTAMATLPAGWRPPNLIEAMWDSGFNDGGATISTSGVITLRTTSGSNGIQTSQAPRVTACWISQND
ncbi:hypothetical protein SEA_YARA_23 [Streptomyces phage Yara]|nr:hypothetical protein SEA_YARA_23 [Streptomyces phage Yara]